MPLTVASLLPGHLVNRQQTPYSCRSNRNPFAIAALVAGLALGACDDGKNANSDGRERDISDGPRLDVIEDTEDLGTSNDAAVTDAFDDQTSTADAAEETRDTNAPDADESIEVEPVTIHRLNRVEYNNSIRDLFGVDLRPADDFPADDTGHGFDNIADVLSLSPLQIELYERAAELVASEVVRVPLTERIAVVVLGSDGVSTVGAASGTRWLLWSAGELTTRLSVPEDGLYTYTVRVAGEQAGDELVRAELTVDGTVVSTFDVSTEGVSEPLTVEVSLLEGNHTLGVTFVNDYYDPDVGADRNLIVHSLELSGPAELTDVSAAPRTRFVTCDPSRGRLCAEEIFSRHLPRIWRRPVAAQELNRIIALYELGADDGTGSENFDQGLKFALTGALLSPAFIFRPEPAPPAGEVRALDGYELASRLSYFLWSSTPDLALLDAAESGRLTTEAEISAQVLRMLHDERAFALTENFAGQWLYIRNIENAFPDVGVFAEFDESLRVAMKEEMQRFFATFVQEPRNFHQLLTARETFLNARLAEHYGIRGSFGEEFERVDVGASDRGGLLTQAGLLTVLSNPTRTSVVRRGKWVLGQLLCSEPEPPPPGVEGLVPPSEPGLTLRETLELHRANEPCASCHAVMDQIGFGLENYDGIGKWRTDDNGESIDSFGELPGGETFRDAIELAEVLASDEQFAACVARKLFTYALGRGVVLSDRDALAEIRQQFGDNGYTFESLATAIATSDPFRYTAAEVAP